MNNSFSLFVSLSIGVVIGVFLEKQYNFDLSALFRNAVDGNSNKGKSTGGGMYNKSERYQDQSKSDKSKGLTRESKTGNTD